MQNQLTGHQVRIVALAERYLDRMIWRKGDIKTMFREDGPDMSVGLAYSEDGENFIVRETIRWFASKQHVYFVCGRLVRELCASYANIMADRKLFG